MSPRTMSVSILLFTFLGAGFSPAASTRYRVTKGSSVRFKAASNLHGFHGGTDALTGFVVFDPAVPLESSGEVTIDADSLRSGDGKRDRRMRDTALETGLFPEIKFRMRRFVAEPSDGSRAVSGNIHGELELHGVTRKLLVPATVRPRGGGLHVEGTVGFDMQGWDIRPPPTRIFFATLVVLPNVSVSFDLDLDPVAPTAEVSDHDPEASARRLRAMAAALRARRN